MMVVLHSEQRATFLCLHMSDNSFCNWMCCVYHFSSSAMLKIIVYIIVMSVVFLLHLLLCIDNLCPNLISCLVSLCDFDVP